MKHLPIQCFIILFIVSITYAGNSSHPPISTPTMDANTKDHEQVFDAARLTFSPLLNKDTSNSSPLGMSKKIGTRREASSALSHGKLTLQDGSSNEQSIFALAVQSYEAKAIRIGIYVENLPDSAILHFGNDTAIHTVTGAHINSLLQKNIEADGNSDSAKTYWSPVIEGEKTTVNIILPAAIQPSALDVHVPAISHIFENDRINTESAGSCYNDVMCSSGWNHIRRSTAKITVTNNGDSFACTGTLLEDIDTTTDIPYFVTSNHCAPNQTVASSMQVHWHNEAASCNSSSLSSESSTQSGGATLLWGRKMTSQPNNNNMDVSFLQLNDEPPETVRFADWSASSTATGQYFTIHHPGDEMKKISTGLRQQFYDCWKISSSSFNCMPSSSGNFVRINWQTGGTTSGSMGAGLFPKYGKLKATLSGSSGNPCNVSHSYFSLFYKAYRKGNLSKWLKAPPPEPEKVIIIPPLNYLLLKKK